MGDEETAQIGYRTRALKRALMILEEFKGDSEPISLARLQRSLDLPKPTIVRLAALLEEFGYLRRRDGGYELGPKNLELGSIYLRRHRIVDVVRPILEHIRNRLTETVCLATISGHDVLRLDVIPTSTDPTSTDIGSETFAHTTALGKAILSTIDEAELEGVIGRPPYAALTRNSLITRSGLVADLRATRKRGYALDNEESSLGLRCVGVAAVAPVLETVAMSVSASPSTITDRAIPRLVAELSWARDQIESGSTTVTG